MDFFFQSPPRPLQFWPDPPPVPANFVRPGTFREKHFGQWCRNLTLDRHIQCPRASPFHWYICCGDEGTECCFGIQSWVYVIFGTLSMIFFMAALFWLYLGPTNYGASANAKVVDRTGEVPTLSETECQKQQTQHDDEAKCHLSSA